MLSLAGFPGSTYARTALSGQWRIGQATNVFNAGASPEPIVLRDINTTVSQNITGVTAQAGVTYTLNIDLGFGKGQADLGNAQLWIGGKEVIATPATGDPALSAMQYSGKFYDYVASYTATSANTGDDLEIILSSLTGQTNYTAWYADVRLTELIDRAGAGPTGCAGARDLGNDADRLLRNGWRCRCSPLSAAAKRSRPARLTAKLRAGGLRA